MLAIDKNIEELALQFDLVLEVIGVEYIDTEFFCILEYILVATGEFCNDFVLCICTLRSKTRFAYFEEVAGNFLYRFD